MTDAEALLAIAVAAMTPAGRSENPPAMRLAWRIQRLVEPLPVGFIKTTEQEASAYYNWFVKQPAPRPPVEPVSMTDEEAARLYHERITRA